LTGNLVAMRCLTLRSSGRVQSQPVIEEISFPPLILALGGQRQAEISDPKACAV